MRRATTIGFIAGCVAHEFRSKFCGQNLHHPVDQNMMIAQPKESNLVQLCSSTDHHHHPAYITEDANDISGLMARTIFCGLVFSHVAAEAREGAVKLRSLSRGVMLAQHFFLAHRVRAINGHLKAIGHSALFQKFFPSTQIPTIPGSYVSLKTIARCDPKYPGKTTKFVKHTFPRLPGMMKAISGNPSAVLLSTLATFWVTQSHGAHNLELSGSLTKDWSKLIAKKSTEYKSRLYTITNSTDNTESCLASSMGWTSGS